MGEGYRYDLTEQLWLRVFDKAVIKLVAIVLLSLRLNWRKICLHAHSYGYWLASDPEELLNGGVRFLPLGSFHSTVHETAVSFSQSE